MGEGLGLSGVEFRRKALTGSTPRSMFVKNSQGKVKDTVRLNPRLMKEGRFVSFRKVILQISPMSKPR